MPRSGWWPPQQSLKPADLVIGQRDERLIEQFEFLERKRLAQVKLQRAPRLHACIHFGDEETKDAAAVLLGAVRRQIGVFQELVGIRCRHRARWRCRRSHR